MYAGHLRTTRALGNERNILYVRIKADSTLESVRLPSQVLRSPPLYHLNRLVRNVLGRKTPRRIQDSGGAGVVGGIDFTDPS